MVAMNFLCLILLLSHKLVDAAKLPVSLQNTASDAVGDELDSSLSYDCPDDITSNPSAQVLRPASVPEGQLFRATIPVIAIQSNVQNASIYAVDKAGKLGKPVRVSAAQIAELKAKLDPTNAEDGIRWLPLGDLAPNATSAQSPSARNRTRGSRLSSLFAESSDEQETPPPPSEGQWLLVCADHLFTAGRKRKTCGQCIFVVARTCEPRKSILDDGDGPAKCTTPLGFVVGEIMTRGHSKTSATLTFPVQQLPVNEAKFKAIVMQDGKVVATKVTPIYSFSQAHLTIPSLKTGLYNVFYRVYYDGPGYDDSRPAYFSQKNYFAPLRLRIGSSLLSDDDDDRMPLGLFSRDENELMPAAANATASPVQAGATASAVETPLANVTAPGKQAKTTRTTPKILHGDDNDDDDVSKPDSS